MVRYWKCWIYPLLLNILKKAISYIDIMKERDSQRAINYLVLMKVLDGDFTVARALWDKLKGGQFPWEFLARHTSSRVPIVPYVQLNIYRST